jgi:hypothetical protein
MLLLLFGSFAYAASEVGGERDFGIGLSIGSQVEGISVKLHDSTAAYQMVIGGYGGFGNFGEVWGLRLDWLAEIPAFVQTDVIDLAANLGVGGFGGYVDPEFEGGAEAVLALEALLVPIPVDVVVEWTPMFLLTNPPWDYNGPVDNRFHPVAFALHARVWF